MCNNVSPVTPGGWLQVNGIVCDEWSATSNIWTIHQCTLDFSISKELSNCSNNCMSQSTRFTPRLLTSEHIFIARLKEYQWINKCQGMTMLTACDKRSACHLVLCRRDNPVEQDSRGLDLNFPFFFCAASHLFAAIQPAGRRWKGLPAGASEQHVPPAHLTEENKEAQWLWGCLGSMALAYFPNT